MNDRNIVAQEHKWIISRRGVSPEINIVQPGAISKGQIPDIGHAAADHHVGEIAAILECPGPEIGPNAVGNRDAGKACTATEHASSHTGDCIGDRDAG